MSDGAIEQHPRASVGFKGSKQATDDTYAYLRGVVLKDIREKSSEEFLERVDLTETQILRATIEDGVLSYEATHPSVTHEDEMEGSFDV